MKSVETAIGQPVNSNSRDAYAMDKFSLLFTRLFYHGKLMTVKYYGGVKFFL